MRIRREGAVYGSGVVEGEVFNGSVEESRHRCYFIVLGEDVTIREKSRFKVREVKYCFKSNYSDRNLEF